MATSRRCASPAGWSDGVKLLILEEPTRGVDIGARREIYGKLRELTAKGYAVDHPLLRCRGSRRHFRPLAGARPRARRRTIPARGHPAALMAATAETQTPA